MNSWPAWIWMGEKWGKLALTTKACSVHSYATIFVMFRCNDCRQEAKKGHYGPTGSRSHCLSQYKCRQIFHSQKICLRLMFICKTLCQSLRWGILKWKIYLNDHVNKVIKVTVVFPYGLPKCNQQYRLLKALKEQFLQNTNHSQCAWIRHGHIIEIKWVELVWVSNSLSHANIDIS